MDLQLKGKRAVVTGGSKGIGHAVARALLLEGADVADTKVTGYIRCAREVVPGMRAAGWGRIVTVSGLAARQTGGAPRTIHDQPGIAS